MTYTNYKSRHYFNNILFTPWPFCIGICLFNIVYLTVLMVNKYYFISTSVSLYVLCFFIYLLLESICAWLSEVIEESFYGKYTKKLRAALFYGFLLFLISEVMLFGSFFWAYFDRVFHLSYVTGFLSVPTTVERIRWFQEPLYATILLLGSGYTANASYYFFKCNDIWSLKKAYFFSILTNVLGCIFLYIQYLEYTHLNFTISDTVYCTVFYALTGFHGIHVIIGNLFLMCQYWLKFSYRDNRTYGLAFALIYWHFVDVIWIFLFFTVYFFNNWDYLLVANLDETYYFFSMFFFKRNVYTKKYSYSTISRPHYLFIRKTLPLFTLKGYSEKRSKKYLLSRMMQTLCLEKEKALYSQYSDLKHKVT